MKLWESTHVFDHPWETVTHAAWRKYPNPINPSVKAIDVLDRKVTRNGVLQTKRLFQTEWDIPGWVTSLIGLTNPSYSHEYSEVDPNNKSMTLKTVNLSCTNFISIDEQLKYEPHPQDKHKTLLTQTTEVSLHGVPLVNYLEDMAISTFRVNSAKGRQAMDWVISNIGREYDELTSKLNQELAELSTKVGHEVDALQSSSSSLSSSSCKPARVRRGSLIRHFFRQRTNSLGSAFEHREPRLFDVDCS